MSGRAVFITLEGGEGAGKSTQAGRLATYLVSKGRKVHTTREPGGSPQAEAIRELLVTGTAERWSPLAETLLNNAAREDHVRTIIKPALKAGTDVICDRFTDSTRAYQGAAGGVDMDVIKSLETAVLGNLRPHLTLIFDLPVDVGLSRLEERQGAMRDRYEGRDTAFHETLRQAFLAIAHEETERCAIIDAAADPDTVFAQIIETIDKRLEL